MNEIGSEFGEFVEALVTASRALVAIAARSLAGIEEDVTLPQYRALILVASRGPQSVASLAHHLGVTPATATRMCDRLERKKLIERVQNPSDRRQVEVSLTTSARELIATVTQRRREEIEDLARTINPEDRVVLIEALRQLGAASGEPRDSQWSPEWNL